MPPRCTENDGTDDGTDDCKRTDRKKLKHKLALAAIAGASYATASSLKVQAVNHKL